MKPESPYGVLRSPGEGDAARGVRGEALGQGGFGRLRGHLVGRVEHVVSGQATTFHTLEGLLTFLARVLTERGAGPPEGE